MERKQQHDKLLNEWKEARPAYEINGEFTCDGPSNWEVYFNEPLRIMFLSKESRQGYLPNYTNNPIKGPRPLNMIRWIWIIQQLYSNRGHEVTPPNNNTLKQLFHNNFSRFAEIEVKKMNAEQKISLNSDIESYATRDQEFIREQISLIDPHIIICAKTFSSYKIIYQYEFDNGQVKDLVNGECSSFMHNNRLVIDFYHPAYTQIPGGNEAFYQLWHTVLKNGEVFEQFNWSK